MDQPEDDQPHDDQPENGQPENGQRKDGQPEFDRVWREHRRRLLAIAFRMLGDVGEAEDVVQEAFTRLVRVGTGVSEIEDVGGWLVVVTSRLCLDRLRSIKRHPTAPGAELDDRPPAPTAGPTDPADRVTLDDSVRVALHLVLDRLSAAERTAFVLHDVFGYPFDAIAEVVGRTPAACRQLASRGRRTVREESARVGMVVERPEHRRVTERFIDACSTGNLDELLAILDPDVVGRADIGGGAGRPRRGATAVARGIFAFLGSESSTVLLSLPGSSDAIAVLQDHQVAMTVTLTVQGERITRLDIVLDPDTLAPLRTLLGAPAVPTEHGAPEATPANQEDQS